MIEVSELYGIKRITKRNFRYMGGGVQKNEPGIRAHVGEKSYAANSEEYGN